MPIPVPIFNPRHKLVFYRIDGRDDEGRDKLVDIGRMRADRNDFPGRQTALADGMALRNKTRYLVRPTVRANLPRRKQDSRDSIGQPPIGDVPVGGEASAKFPPRKTSGVNYVQNDLIHDLNSDELWKILSFRETYSTTRLIEITCERTAFKGKAVAA